MVEYFFTFTHCCGSLMAKSIFSTLLFFLGCTLLMQGQYYSTGQDPASLRWFQIKTDSFRIIFPEKFTSNSRYLAGILELTTRYETNTLKAKVPRMPFIIHSESVTSNGVTVWAPRRIELYTCPPQDTYSEEWLEQLALHEYRHAVQTSKMNQGFSRALFYLFGEQATGAVLGLFIPTWFLEGDATVTETALSNSGRGRMASFEAPLRAQLLQKGIYPYDLATLGSYKTFTPDDYTLGYQLVAKGREHWGYELWDSSLDKAARYPFMVVPFNSGIRKKTGLWKTGFYKTIMEELLVEWQHQEDDSWQSPFKRLTNPDPGDYTTWDRPQFGNNGEVIAACWSNEKVPKIKSIHPEGDEKPIKRLGAYEPGSLSVAGDFIVWTESWSDIRWANRNYSVIRWKQIGRRTGGQADRRTSGQTLTSGQADKRTGRQALTSGQADKRTGRDEACLVLTIKGRYFAPAVSPDGSRVLAVRITEENRSFIDILEVSSGRVLHSIPAPAGGLFLQPSWSVPGEKIGFILLTSEGKSLQVMDTTGSSVATILAPSFRDISGPPLFYGNFLLFSADYTGIGNIFAVDTISRKLYQVTSSRFGARQPALSPGQSALVYSDYTADGWMIASAPSNPSGWITLDSVPDYRFPLAEAMAGQEGVNIQDSVSSWQWTSGQADRRTDEQADKRTSGQADKRKRAPRHHGTTAPQYSVSRYRKASHLFNVHSWAPLSIDANNLTLKPGVSVLSQNLLSTAFAGAGYEYDLNERTGRGYFNFSYQGWFPVIDLTYSYGKRAGTARNSQTGEALRFTWNESDLQVTVSIPLNLTRGIWYRKIQPSIGSSWIYVIHDKTTPQAFTTGSINTLDYRLFLYNYLRSNYQDMFPKWGQRLDVGYRHTPFSGNDLGAVFGISGSLYFPGLFRHHGIALYGGYQRRWNQLVYGYQFSNLITLPRGTEVIYPEKLISLSANYKFPFLRIDASLGSVLYIKRFKLNLFYDWSHGWEPGEDTFTGSTGFELTSELHILRFLAPFELGVQGVYLPDEGNWAWRFLWGVSL